MSEGVKRYQPASVEGRVARMVEDRARNEFGPELLDKEEVAAALNLTGEGVTEEEWEEISEFALNAGAVLLSRAASHDPLPTTRKEEAALERRIQKNKYRMFPIHDLFHAADEYRATGGKAVTAPFVEVGVRERYTDPSLIRSELWPALFLISPTMDAPLAVLLASPEGRQDLDDALGEGAERPSAVRREITELLDGPVPESPEALRAEYERLVGLLVIANAIEKVPDIVEREVLALRAEATRIGENPDHWYDQFARRVFSGEWRENPRLFLDELLAAIRTAPEPAEAYSERRKTFTDAIEQAEIEELFISDGAEAIASLAESIAESKLLVLGEVHGVRENAELIYTLMHRFNMRRLALEWQPTLVEALKEYLASGEPHFDAYEREADGRLTAEHFAMLKKLHTEGHLDEVIGLLPAQFAGSFDENDAAMAERVLKARGSDPLLVVAGNYHTRTEEVITSEGGTDVPMGKTIRDRLPAVPFAVIHYASGEHQNLGLKTLGPTESLSAKDGVRMYWQDERVYVFEIPKAHPATVPDPARTIKG